MTSRTTPPTSIAAFAGIPHQVRQVRHVPQKATALRWLGYAWALSATLTWAQDASQLDLPRITLQAGMHRIDAQLAVSADQRSTGLMHRKEMPTHEGMLFVFEQASVQCFWMKNTLLPLTAAFVADDGVIVNLEDMKPQTLNSHCSAKPVRYVLEMNHAWFNKRGIKAGFKLTGRPFELGK